MGLNKTGTGAGTTDTLPMEGDPAEAPMGADVQCMTGFTLVAGVRGPQSNEGMADPAVFECGPGLHYQPSGEKGTDSLLAAGTCVADYSPPVQADEVSPEDLITESVKVEEVQAALEAAGPVFTPVVGCCTTEIGNAIVTGLLENYRSELETIY